MMGNPIKAVIFDLDGTLIDSAASLHHAAAGMMRDLHLPEPDLATVTGFVGNGVPKLVARCLHWAGADAARQAEGEAAFRTIYDADPVTGVQVFAGVHDMLSDLAAAPILTGLCTNKPVTPTRILLAKLPLGPFDAVVGGDTLPVRKPDPAPLLRCCADLGLSPEHCVYVGDSRVDALTAEAASLRYLHITGGYQNGELPVPPWQTFANVPDLRAFLGAVT